MSLPAANLLRRAGFHVTLHCAAYARDIALWGLENGLYDALWAVGEPPPEHLDRETWGLALYRSKPTLEAFRSLRLKRCFGPYSKPASYLDFTKGLRQRRSQVVKSEMAYNLDLARGLAAWAGLDAPAFVPLPVLHLPERWTSPRPSPDWVAVLSSGGSAQNWPVERYLSWLADQRAPGSSLDFLVQGVDAEARLAALQASGILDQPGVGLVRSFDQIRDLIAYLSGAGQVLSSSTGPLHIAYAAGLPVYGIFPDEPRVESFERWQPAGYANPQRPIKLPLLG
ncbi:MAG: hypothetical protein AAFY02_18230 [Pseudomonadota bacterium]